jgi:hypothetical protein
MGSRPMSFDMSKMSQADKILGVAGLLFFIDTFLPWQHACASFGSFKVCASASAWGGDGSALGVLAGIFSILLVLWVAATVAGMNVQIGVPASTISAVLVAGTVLFGVIKFLIAVFNHPGFGSWIGIILLAAIAYGGYLKMQEPKTTPMPPSSMGGTPPPPPPM